MRALLDAIPDAEILLGLAPEELGERILFLLKARLRDRPRDFNNNGEFHPHSMMSEVWPRTTLGPEYPKAKEREINQAQIEAWHWLRTQGHIVEAPGLNGSQGWCVLSRRAEKLKTPADFQAIKSGSKPTREVLHPQVAMLWPRLLTGDLDGAAFNAMHSVEVAVREAAGLPNSDIGVDLMRKAFNPKDGPLTDKTSEPGEREALSHIFAGAIGTYKNPRSHRRVNLANVDEAVEILMLASNLLRIVERARPS